MGLGSRQTLQNQRAVEARLEERGVQHQRPIGRAERADEIVCLAAAREAREIGRRQVAVQRRDVGLASGGFERDDGAIGVARDQRGHAGRAERLSALILAVAGGKLFDRAFRRVRQPRPVRRSTRRRRRRRVGKSAREPSLDRARRLLREGRDNRLQFDRPLRGPRHRSSHSGRATASAIRMVAAMARPIAAGRSRGVLEVGPVGDGIVSVRAFIGPSFRRTAVPRSTARQSAQSTRCCSMAARAAASRPSSAYAASCQASGQPAGALRRGSAATTAPPW